MNFRKTIVLGLAFLLPLSAAGASAQTSTRSGNAVFDRAVQLVLRNFYAPDELGAFRDAVDLTVESMPDLANADPAIVADAIDFVLASLETSHTARYAQDFVAYYELVDVFRFGIRDAVRRLYPGGDVVYPGVGMVTASRDGKVFVTDVYPGSKAAEAGLLVGDEILAADGAPFEPVGSFEGKTGQGVVLGVRRTADAEPITVTVDVAELQPTETLLTAIRESAEVFERDGYRIGYLRLWSYTDRSTRSVIEEALAGPLANADALVLDLRSRWGGAPPDAADTFVGGSPDMTLVYRDGRRELAHARWRKPIVAIIDEGTRSGMEILAHGLKAAGVTMVGTPTAGDVVAGRGYMLPDDSLLIIAVADVFVDGIRLEGHGVLPDIEAPFDIRYAAGKDPQLEAALAEMVRSLRPPAVQ